MADFRGTVSGIDVLEYGAAKALRCFAIITPAGASSREIQVITEAHPLQTALELASGLKVEVEVTYNEIDGEKTLTRVRLLDR
ncbi:MAG: hypothetical protein JO328_00460 [Hyphomicrobiales bacterium]|nr:hypothetical protein [Hyphomicrobiales bacterium]MBV8826328.1 hypothetical protein [Hyphomicrobiales bacterium]